MNLFIYKLKKNNKKKRSLIFLFLILLVIKESIFDWLKLNLSLYGTIFLRDKFE